MEEQLRARIYLMFAWIIFFMAVAGDFPYAISFGFGLLIKIIAETDLEKSMIFFSDMLYVVSFVSLIVCTISYIRHDFARSKWLSLMAVITSIGGAIMGIWALMIP